MYIKKGLFLLVWYLLIQTVKSKPSIQDDRLSEEISMFLDEYFNWKIDTYKFTYYVNGFNNHAGQLDDLSLEKYQQIEIACERFQTRADEILNRKGIDMKVRDRRYVKLVKKEAELCVDESKMKV